MEATLTSPMRRHAPPLQWLVLLIGVHACTLAENGANSDVGVPEVSLQHDVVSFDVTTVFGDTGVIVEDGLALQPAVELRWKTIEIGRETACGLTTDSRVYCWGKNYSRALWGGAMESRRPRRIPLQGQPTDLHVYFGDTACATFADQSLKCWGSNLGGMLGRDIIERNPNGLPGDNHEPAETALPRIQLVSSQGVYSICAVVWWGDLYCWGSGAGGMLGSPPGWLVCGDGTGCSAHPQLISLPNVRNVVGLESALCATDSAGVVSCWGRNASGIFGDGTFQFPCGPGECEVMRPQPSLVRNADRLVALDRDSLCAVLRDGTLSCWGNGLNPNPDRSLQAMATPFVTRFRAPVSQVFSSSDFACVRLTDQSTWCWTYALDESGQRRSPSMPTTPREERFWDRFVSFGGRHQVWYGIDREGKAWMWGQGSALISTERTAFRGVYVDPEPLAQAVE